jgi:hypothetical protein
MAATQNEQAQTETVQLLTPTEVKLASSPLYLAFEVSSDSVVATARIRFKKDRIFFRLDWGDDHISSGIHLENRLQHTGISQNTPEGEIILTHVYEVSEDKKPFDKLITLRMKASNGEQDVAIRSITLKPRYKVVAHSFHFQPKDFEDSFVERNDSWVINLISLQPMDQGTNNKQWRFGFGSTWVGDRPFYQLAGATLSHEVVAGQKFQYKLEFLEIDPIFNDHLFSTRIVLSPHDTTERVILGNKNVNLYYTRLVNLIIPLPRYDGLVVSNE